MIEEIGNILDKYDLRRFFVQRHLDYFLVMLSMALGIYLNWEITNIAMIAFIVWIILNPLSSQIMIKISLFSIFIISVMLILQKTDLAETVAIIAYYFLVLTVIVAINEHNYTDSSHEL